MMNEFTINGTKYTTNGKGYFFKEENGKKVRIKRDEFEQAMAQASTKEKTKKVKKSKDIAFATTITLADDKIANVTLTKKQVNFLKRLPEDDFYEHGLDSSLWIDVFCDTVADKFNPMAVGAMVSTLREKDLIHVGVQKMDGRKCKFFGFTELGKQVAKELGLE